MPPRKKPRITNFEEWDDKDYLSVDAKFFWTLFRKLGNSGETNKENMKIKYNKKEEEYEYYIKDSYMKKELKCQN